LKVHERSGAAVSVAEFPRLQPFVPNSRDKPETVKRKLEMFRSEYANLINDLMSEFSEDRGYEAYPIDGQPSTPATSKVIDYKDLPPKR
jgi:hypothetical protein